MKRAERSHRRRREMLEAYYQTLLDEGLQGASIAKIARRLDVPPSLLIHYFGTKEQMTIELVDYLLEAFHETYGAKLAAIADPRERLLAILDEFFSPEYHQLLDDRAFYACFYLSLTHPKVREAYAALYESSLELVETAIGECIAAGVIPRDDAHELAMAVKAMEEGYAFLIGGGADEAVKATMGKVLKERVLGLLGLDGVGGRAAAG
jgi:AcrR family transcriptional regulator